VISVDGKKKKLVGNFRSDGREYGRAGELVATNVYDFTGELGKVTRYGVYDLAANTGWVSVEPTTTPARSRSSRSAAGGTRSAPWLPPRPTGCRSPPTAEGPTVTGYRLRPWKRELAELATQTGLMMTVCQQIWKPST
jgi:hypothetical protein